MNLNDKDQHFIWHPLTQHKTAKAPILIKKAAGVFLYDEDENAYIDGISSWYCSMYGHCNPYIIDKVKAQLSQLNHVVFTGFTHEPAILLAEKIIEITAPSIQKVFYSENGSTAVDAALKMAIQFHHNKGNNKYKFLCFENAFHGDTFGAMSVSGLSVYNGPFEKVSIEVVKIPLPNEANISELLIEIKKLIKIHDFAGFIYEPIVQGAAGMKFYKPEHLDAILALNQENNILNIADEVMTGLGKTDRLFASDYMHVQPDIMCLSKSLSAGVVPLAITACSTKVFEAFYDNNLSKGFFHAHTYSGNSVACTAALAALELLTSKEISEQRKEVSLSHEKFKKHILKHPKVKTARSIGMIFALEINVDMDRYGDFRNKISQFCMNKGVYLRPLGNIIYCLPPFVIKPEELNKIYQVIEDLLNQIEQL